jgi:hypothetical protein
MGTQEEAISSTTLSSVGLGCSLLHNAALKISNIQQDAQEKYILIIFE